MVSEWVGDGPLTNSTIQRHAADAELGAFQSVYRTDDGRILTLDEASKELLPEMAAGLEDLSFDKRVIDGGDVEEFIFESGIFERIEVEGQIVTQYTDGRSRWTAEQLREQMFLSSDRGDLSFEQWCSSEVASGNLVAVDVLQFVGYEDEDSEQQTVITERLIVD